MNAADEKAWREYQKDLGPSGREGTMSAHIIKSALLAGRASRNSEVEELRNAIILKDAVIAMHEGEIKQLRQALTKGDSDAG